MGKNVLLERKDNGAVKEAKAGFSWTNLFFGFFTPLVRGDWKWALIQLITATITFGISLLVFPFIYNKIYLKGLIESGYAPADDRSAAILRAKNIF